jgi:hypothetical protein
MDYSDRLPSQQLTTYSYVPFSIMNPVYNGTKGNPNLIIGYSHPRISLTTDSMGSLLDNEPPYTTQGLQD